MIPSACCVSVFLLIPKFLQLSLSLSLCEAFQFGVCKTFWDFWFPVFCRKPSKGFLFVSKRLLCVCHVLGLLFGRMKHCSYGGCRHPLAQAPSGCRRNQIVGRVLSVPIYILIQCLRISRCAPAVLVLYHSSERCGIRHLMDVQ